MSGILYSDYYLPSNEIKIEDIIKNSKHKHARDEDFIECFVSQSRQQTICIENEKEQIQIFEELLAKMLEKGDIQAEEVTHILYTSPNDRTEAGVYIPYYLQEHFGFMKATIIGMVQECVTTLQAMRISDALVESGQANKVLILSICYGWNMEDRYTGNTVVGDGAGIMVVGKSENMLAKIINGTSLSQGTYSFYKYLKMPPKVSGMEIAKQGKEFINTFISNNQLTFDDIYLMILQNINYSEYHMYTQYLGIDMEKIFSQNISKGGHLAEVDSIRNFTDYIRANQTSVGHKLLMFGSGTIGDGMDAVYNAVLLEA